MEAMFVPVGKSKPKKEEELYISPNDKGKERVYIPISEYNAKDHVLKLNNAIKSKVLVIDNISVTITQDLDKDLEFKVDCKPGVLSDKITIPNMDICSREDIVFDEDITLSKLESIIRRCGVLEQYSDYLTNDPDIVINSYTLNIKKTYSFFNEFKEGVLIGEEIFM